MTDNPLYLISDPAESCPVCGTFLRDASSRTYALRGCPFGPHDERDYPTKDSA